MELETRRFYEAAAARVTDARIRSLLNDLALVERRARRDAPKRWTHELRPDGVRSDEESDPPSALRPADRAAGARRTDGRIGLDAGAALRRGVCDARHVGRVSRRHGRVGWRRHLDGIRRSAVGRWIDDGPGAARAARSDLRRDDDGRRDRSHAAVSHSRAFTSPPPRRSSWSRSS